MSIASKKQPRVSVLVPSYNHAPYVERCLKSIIKQGLTPSELLVIDDGSQDDSVRIIEGVLKDCPFSSSLIRNSNKGLCATLNEGLQKTRGDYFAYLGSDDIWLPEFLEERVELLQQRENAVLAYGHAYLIDEHDRIIECSDTWTKADYRDGDARPMLHCGVSPVSSTVVYRRSALERRGWNEGARLEDYELYLQLAEDGNFAFDPKILSAWRMHDYNTSRDSAWLLTEVLAAQRRVGSMMKWDERKRHQVETATRFQFSEFFVRKGHKAMALSMLLKNLKGAPSIKRIGEVVLRLMIPQSVLNARRRHVQNKVAERYGVLQF